ncbi:hypothetical protein [Brevibacillus choshinensis]|uniref:hypothetical protein n=1 Tax=Brevibacillus choshinensis TaxID=54911 RepID=UPI002E2307E9|nr:hypothetical protein [Brevibacillus choshinensis]
MAKRSKWLKWKIGGGLIVSLAVVFQVAKADPAFGKAVQAAQDNDDSFDPKEDALADQDQTQAEEKPVEEWEHKVSQASVETVLSPAATTPVKNAVTPKKQPIKHSVPKAVASSKPSKSEGKQVVSPKAETAPAPVQKQPASVKSPAVEQPTEVPPAAPPADIPVAHPAESTTVTPADSNSGAAVQVEDSTATQAETKPSKKKKSHSKSHHS